MVNSVKQMISSLALRFVLVIFSLLSIAVTTSYREERAGLSVFCAFVCFSRFGLCLFILPLGVRDWLPFVIVTRPGLFCSFSHTLTDKCCEYSLEELGGALLITHKILWINKKQYPRIITKYSS